MTVWNDKMTAHQAASEQVSINSAFTWSLLLANAYQFCSSNMRVIQHHSAHALDMSTIKVFVYLGLQHKWNQLSPNNSRHTSYIHKWLYAGKWPDLMTSKPDALSTLGYYWTDCNGTTLVDAMAQWSWSGNPVLICIIGTHWKTTEDIPHLTLTGELRGICCEDSEDEKIDRIITASRCMWITFEQGWLQSNSFYR